MKRLSQFKRALVQLLTVALLVQPVSAFAAADVVADAASTSQNAVSQNEVVTNLDAVAAPTVAAVKAGKISKGISLKVSGLNALTVTAKTKVLVEGAFEITGVDAKDAKAKAAKAKVKTNKKAGTTVTTIAPKVSKKTGDSYVVTYVDKANANNKLVLTVVNPAANFKAYKKIVLATTAMDGLKAVGAVSTVNGVETIKISVYDATSSLNGTGIAGVEYNKVAWDTKVKGDATVTTVDNGAAIVIAPKADAKGAVKVKLTVNGKKYSTAVKFDSKALKANKIAKQNAAREAVK